MISAVIPALNEEETIGETIAQVRQALGNLQHEIVVVDDGSSDATAERACAAGARAIRHPHNLGYGAALKAGIKAATYDTIVTTDADGTYPSEAIPDLLKEYGKGFDLVVGARTGAYYHESALKTVLRLVLKWLVEYTTGSKIPDVNSGLRVFSKKIITKYFDTLCDTFSFTTSLTLAYMLTKKFVAHVPIAYQRRTGGQTKVHLFRDALRTLQYIVQAILYYNPLKIFLLICGLLAIGSVFFLLLAALLGSVNALYLGIAGLLMTIQVFCFGLLAELLRQIMSK